MKFLKEKLRFKFLIPIVIIAGIFLFITKSRAETDFNIPQVAQSQSDYSWWNNDFAFRRKIVPSSGVDQVLKLNHSQLVIDNKSVADGSDLKVVSDEDGTFEEVAIDIINVDQIETYINFSYSKKDTQLYLYYGNKSELSKPNIRDIKYSNVNQTASLMDEETPSLTITVQKKWNLREVGSKLLVQVNDSGITENSNYFYLVDDSNNPINLNIQNNLASIDISSIQDGYHKIFIIRKSDSQIERSNSTVFIVSEPIYVAWTIDWEGIDPGKQNMENVAKIADEYKIPLSHFFSPRTLINLKITDARKKEIINWLKSRIANSGDEIDMLLHFQFDLVEEAGVDAKFKEKTWDNGLSGYDIPGTVYNYDEYSKILSWGKKKITDAGLPTPKGFRAGGWFINEENLRAVKDTGFLYDSSSIKPIELGENKMIQDWNVTSITQPYKLDPKNKNSKSEDASSTFEIPINGGDTYINTDQDIKQNFIDNYSSNDFSNTSKLVVYSSSPEWIETGKDGLENLFASISNFRYDIDRGPIKFVTLSDWYTNNIK
ncbi:MAG: hypothetical protein ACMG57_05615 [Candidatus Dojkabacteria bacterium]